MKKICLLLMVGIIAVFTACDEKDPAVDPVPINPVTDYKVPESGGIGKDVTISGKGFAKEAKIFLRGTEAAMKEAVVKTVTAVDLVFTVPEDIKAGDYTVVLRQNGDFELGKIQMKVESPLTGCVVPKELQAGLTDTIMGKGFKEGCELWLKPASGESVQIKEIALVEGGLEFSFPADLTPGVYTVVLKQDGEWELDPITVKSAVKRLYKIIRESDGEKDMDMDINYDKYGKIISMTWNALTDGGDYKKWDFVYSESKVTVNYTTRVNKEEKSGSYEYTLNGAGDVENCTYLDDGTTETWRYNDNGFLTEILDKDNETLVNYTYDGNTITDVAMEWDGFTFEYTNSPAYRESDAGAWNCVLYYFNCPDAFLRMLGICGKPNSFLPTEVSGWDHTIGYSKGEGDLITTVTLTDISWPEEPSSVVFTLEY